MNYPTHNVSRSVARVSVSRGRRRPAALSLACFAALPGLFALACSAGDASQPAASQGDTRERNNGSFDADAVESLAAGQVLVDDLRLTGSCAQGRTTFHKSDSERYAGVIFGDQTYGGDRNDPNYAQGRTADKPRGDAKETTPKCQLHIRMKVTTGYKFSPTNLLVRGFAHSAFVYTAYRWEGAESSTPVNGRKVTDDGYTFEQQVPLNPPTYSSGDDFVIRESLYNLWSPTCKSSSAAMVDAELVVTVQPYTRAGTSNTIVAVDSIDVSGFGTFQKCNEPTNYDRVAGHGEACGVVDGDQVHRVRCNTTPPVNNICVTSPTGQADTGICIDQNRKPSASELTVGPGDYCGGPYFAHCDESQGLVCQFPSGDHRQNANMHYGTCVNKLPLRADCKAELYGACNGNTCNSLANPCQSGSECKAQKCSAK